MNNQTNNGRPQLKKIKRPINRTSPVSEARPASGVSIVEAIEKPTQTEIDRYLDTPAAEENEPADFFAPSKAERPKFIGEDEYSSEIPDYIPSQTNGFAWLTPKTLALFVVISLFCGVIMGKLIFGESKVVNGLQGVVVNSEVPRGRARCGIAERAQGCVLYAMNPHRQDILAKDFYDMAAQMTGRQRFMIETGNMRYANTKIRPGEIAQLNIPPL